MTQAAQDPIRTAESASGSHSPASGTPDPDQQRVLEERYGRGRGRRVDRRFAWIAGAALVIAGVIVLGYLAAQTREAVEFRDLAYTVVDERTVEIDFEVTAPPGSAVVCELEALSTSYAQVGWKMLELPVSEQRTRRFDEVLVTAGPATTGYIKSCWIHGS